MAKPTVDKNLQIMMAIPSTSDNIFTPAYFHRVLIGLKKDFSYLKVPKTGGLYTVPSGRGEIYVSAYDDYIYNIDRNIRLYDFEEQIALTQDWVQVYNAESKDIVMVVSMSVATFNVNLSKFENEPIVIFAHTKGTDIWYCFGSTKNYVLKDSKRPLQINTFFDPDSKSFDRIPINIRDVDASQNTINITTEVLNYLVNQ